MALRFAEQSGQIADEKLRPALTVDGETRLLMEARSEDSAAWNELFQRYHKRILRLAVRITRNHEDAEDVVQVAFQRAFTHLDGFKGGSAFSTWLTRIAINEALMVIRRRKGALAPLEGSANSDSESSASIEIEDSRATPEERYSHLELKDTVIEGVLGLRPSLRAVVLLREMRDFSTEETASVLGISIAAVKARMFHARNKLRKKFSGIVEIGGKPVRSKTAPYATSVRAGL